jgi:hypothetical protein
MRFCRYRTILHGPSPEAVQRRSIPMNRACRPPSRRRSGRPRKRVATQVSCAPPCTEQLKDFGEKIVQVASEAKPRLMITAFTGMSAAGTSRIVPLLKLIHREVPKRARGFSGSCSKRSRPAAHRGSATPRRPGPAGRQRAGSAYSRAWGWRTALRCCRSRRSRRDT